MTKIINFRQFFGTVSLVLALLIFSSSFTPVSAASDTDLPVMASEVTNQDFSDIIITDENGDVLDPNELVILDDYGNGMIATYSNIVSKQVTITKQSMSGFFWANSISYSAPSGLRTPWKGTLYKRNTYTLQGAILMYYTVYSGTVYATSR